ncbi:MAG: hypothetical protein DWQ01_21620 [Planctomycetota bacterium]|nr:MAG: hypothetical protein DWQ01_21620 [Planctomycetota bacterium]
MKLAKGLATVLAGSLLVGGAFACIEALDLAKMVDRTDTAVRGTITDVRTVKYTPPGDDRLIYTILTIEGEDLFTGKERTLEAAFLGGTYEGDSMMVTSMPAASDYRLGNKVVVFSAPVEGWGPEIDRCVYAAMGGIFKEVATKKGPVFLGKGEGFAIDQNMSLSQLQAGIAKALEAKQKEVK